MKGYNRGNVKVTYSKEGPVFYINEKKRKVVCKFNAWVRVPQENDFFSPISLQPFQVDGIGEAICREGDEFDVERGKRIALARAKSDVYLQSAHRIEEQVEKMNYLKTVGEDFINKAYRVISVHENYVDDLIFPASPNYIDVVEPLKSGVIAQNIRLEKTSE